MEILISVEKLIYTANALLMDDPGNAGIKVILSNFEELKAELTKSEVDKKKIGSIAYGMTRVFTDLLMGFENTSFGNELGQLFIDLYNQYLH
jgi:hypothetical protein